MYAAVLGVLFLATASLAAYGQLSSDASCIDLKRSQSFRFEGVLTHKVFPGAPNYEDLRKGDKPEPAYILRLRKSICVVGDEFIAADKPIDRIQVFPEDANKYPMLWKELRALAGKSVTVDGTQAFGAHTGHHHAPLLVPIIKVSSASRMPKPKTSR